MTRADTAKYGRFNPAMIMYLNMQLLYLSLIVLSVWVMYCRYCVHEYHSDITLTDETQIFKKFIFREGTKQTYNRSFKVIKKQL